MSARLPVAASGFAIALLLSVSAFAQSTTAPTPSGQSAGPPTTGSEQSVNPPNATPGSATATGARGSTPMSARPGSTPPDQVPTTNPAADAKTTPVK